MNKNYESIADDEIKSFWQNYHFTSIYSGQIKLNKKPRYQKYVHDNIALSSFQIDILTYKRNETEGKEKYSYIYILLCIDTVSKYVVSSFINRKLKDDVVQGLSAIIHKIRKLQKNVLTSYMNKDITFYADFGQGIIEKF